MSAIDDNPFIQTPDFEREAEAIRQERVLTHMESDLKAMLARQVGGDHYTKMAIQPFDYIMENRLGWCEGNILKYLSRWQQKDGLSDLYKAQHYLDMLIKRAEDNAKPRV
jgi:hypothetical protein